MAGLNKLLDNAGAIASKDITGDWQTWDGGPGDLWVWGNLGGGQVDLHASLDEDAPLVVCSTTSINVSATKSAVTKFNFNHGTRIRAVVTNTTSASSGIYVKANA